MKPMKALSLRQPWCNAVLLLGKCIENRRWSTSFRGEFLIHAARGMEDYELADAIDFCDDVLGLARWPDVETAFGLPGCLGTPAPLNRGGIVGRARLVAVVRPRPDRVPFSGDLRDHYRRLGPEADAVLGENGWRWHIPGQYGFVLADVQPVPFVPCRGMPSFFEVPDEVLAKVAA